MFNETINVVGKGNSEEFGAQIIFEKVKVRIDCRYVDEHADHFVERLREAVEIPSVSAEPERRPDVLRMIEWTKSVSPLLFALSVLHL